MATLSEIVKVEKDVLYRKFRLEPWYCDPHHKETLVFLSPTVLLDDAKLRDGGYKDRGPKEVLGRLTNDILAEDKSKQHRFFQVPEIPYLHMGYGKTSENKRNRMALTENEGKMWMEFLDLTRHKKPGEVLRKGETPMEVDVTFPTPERPEDYHAFEFEKGEEKELVDPKNSGLKRRVKGSYLLFFSILLIFFKKKISPSTAEDEKIGANKVSDFLSFWILPYLLNFTHQKVNAINAHHAECKRQSGKEGEPFQVPTVNMSALEIIEQAFSSCNIPLELEHFLKEKFRKYYGMPQLHRKYSLPVTRADTPIVLVPLIYKVTDMPVHIEDIGTKWQEIGDVHEFIRKFIRSEEIQTNFLNSFGYLKERFAADYGIILPDEATFTELISKIEDEHADIFQEMPQQGRNIAPRLGLVKDTEKNQSVCVSYFSEEYRNKDLFRLIGSHRLSHFTIIVLYGASINSSDPRCELLNLYPVKAYRKRLYDRKQGVRRLGPKTEGRFCSLEFPETFKLWEQELFSDTVVMKVAQSRDSYPKYEHSKPLEVVYTTSKNLSKLKKDVFGAAVAQDLKALEKCLVRAANLDGCLLQDIARRGRLKKVALILAINDTLGPDGACWPSLQEAMRRVISSFIQAVIVAGVPSVYPPDAFDDDDESDSSSVDNKSYTSEETSSRDSGIPTSISSYETSSRGSAEEMYVDESEDEKMDENFEVTVDNLKGSTLARTKGSKKTIIRREAAASITYEAATSLPISFSLCPPGMLSPPLGSNEVLASNVIKLSHCSPPGDAEGNITVALWHNASNLKGYEVVIKQLVDPECNEWKDLQTKNIWHSSERPGVPDWLFPFAEASCIITHCSSFAAIWRIKTFSFTTTNQHPMASKFVFEVPDFPGVSIEIPPKSVPTGQDLCLTLKVQEFPSSEQMVKEILIGPVLDISCAQIVSFSLPVTIRLPITIPKGGKLPQHDCVRILHSVSGDESHEWDDITESLEEPAVCMQGIVAFKVKHFSRFWVWFTSRPVPPFLKSFASKLSLRSMPQYVKFSTCLLKTSVPGDFGLKMFCYPGNLQHQVDKMLSKYNVPYYAEGNSLEPVCKEDKVFASSALIPQEKKGFFLRFLGDDVFISSDLTVHVESDSVLQVKFFRHQDSLYLCELVMYEVATLPQSSVEVAKATSSSVAPEQKPVFKEGKPSDRELDELAGEIGEKWKKFGIHLGINRVVLHEIEANEDDKPLAVLLRWTDSTDSDTPYRDLYNALCHKRVGLNNLAKEFCCKKTT